MISGLIHYPHCGDLIRVTAADGDTEFELAAAAFREWDDRPQRVRVKVDGWPAWSTFTVSRIGNDFRVKREAA